VNAFYVINILIYAAVDAMACLGLNQQFGVAGVTNFGFIIPTSAAGACRSRCRGSAPRWPAG
jgi:hypothetical protein